MALSRCAGLTLTIAVLGSGVLSAAESSWPQYGGSAAGTRHASAQQITSANVSSLSEAWRFRTGDTADRSQGPHHVDSNFKATPVLVAGKLVFSTGFNRVFALDPGTGREVWRYDPGVDFAVRYSEMYTSRGVTSWVDAESAAETCAKRVFLATLDARLIALDGDTGKECQDFGRAGTVDLSRGITNYRRGEYSVTTPATVVGDVVVVGSSIGDNGGVRLGHGVVRAFDARSGRQRWAFDPLPRSADAPGASTWQAGSAGRTGAANVWSAMAADPARDLVFLPTTSPSPDFFGGARLGDGKYANSLVALRASTGALVWARQLVHHDLWDYDLAAQPMLIDVQHAGEATAAVVLATKMGFVYVLDRETGEPLHEVRERPVPASTVPGEQASETQPFPLVRLHATAPEEFVRWSLNDAHQARCDRQLEGVIYEGIFTPPSLQGTLLYPGNAGGANWGAMAYDPGRATAFVATNRLPTVVRLIPREAFAEAAREGTVNGIKAQFTAQSGTPYGMARYEVYDRELGLPCHRGPWATLAALNPATGSVRWEVPVGAAPGVPPESAAARWGYFASGGPLSLAGGLVFLATPHDRTLAAFHTATGRRAWSVALPAQPYATPMSYAWQGRQYVLIAAGGDRADGQGRGDYLLAFALPVEEP